jgi:hypothetical protein
MGGPFLFLPPERVRGIDPIDANIEKTSALSAFYAINAAIAAVRTRVAALTAETFAMNAEIAVFIADGPALNTETVALNALARPAARRASQRDSAITPPLRAEPITHCIG